MDAVQVESIPLIEQQQSLQEEFSQLSATARYHFLVVLGWLLFGVAVLLTFEFTSAVGTGYKCPLRPLVESWFLLNGVRMVLQLTNLAYCWFWLAKERFPRRRLPRVLGAFHLLCSLGLIAWYAFASHLYFTAYDETWSEKLRKWAYATWIIQTVILATPIVLGLILVVLVYFCGARLLSIEEPTENEIGCSQNVIDQLPRMPFKEARDAANADWMRMASHRNISEPERMAQGLLNSAIATLGIGPTQTFKAFFEETRQCSICYEGFEDENDVIILPCDARHLFHASCIIGWLNRSQLCPLCRVNISTIVTQHINERDSPV